MDRRLKKAIERIATGQQTAEQSIKQAQAGAIAELKRAGVAL